jgi:hypothetical protein
VLLLQNTNLTQLDTRLNAYSEAAARALLAIPLLRTLNVEADSISAADVLRLGGGGGGADGKTEAKAGEEPSDGPLLFFVTSLSHALASIALNYDGKSGDTLLPLLTALQACPLLRKLQLWLAPGEPRKFDEAPARLLAAMPLATLDLRVDSMSLSALTALTADWCERPRAVAIKVRRCAFLCWHFCAHRCSAFVLCAGPLSREPQVAATIRLGAGLCPLA